MAIQHSRSGKQEIDLKKLEKNATEHSMEREISLYN